VPIPINSLFEDSTSVLSNIHKMPNHKDIVDMSKGWPNIDTDITDFPNLNYPDIGTSEYDKDLAIVQKSFLRPTCSDKFLKVSNDKPFKIFKAYIEKNNLDYDMNKLDILNNDLANLVLTLKFKYNRPRPQKQMEISNIEFPHRKIEPNDSPSFPSGHAAHAFFNALMISKQFPEHEMKLRTLAEMISQSRLDLGKHYPSDINFGKYVGEYCAKKVNFNNKKHKLLNESTSISEESALPREVIKNAEIQHNQNNTETSYLDELCEFLIRSNAIERYKIDIDEAIKASESFLNGLPVSYCTKNKYIRSHLDALEEAASLGYIDSPKKVCLIHNKMGNDVLERGESGILRDYEHYARTTGHQYTHPNNILNDLLNWCENTKNDNPFIRHIKYECIHPFSDGNGRSGRIILAADLNFDFKQLNDLIGTDYIPHIVSYQDRIRVKE
jgi:hypothetical protein